MNENLYMRAWVVQQFNREHQQALGQIVKTVLHETIFSSSKHSSVYLQNVESDMSSMQKMLLLFIELHANACNE